MKKKIAHWVCEIHYAIHGWLDTNRLVCWATDLEYPEASEEDRARWKLQYQIDNLDETAEFLLTLPAKDFLDLDLRAMSTRLNRVSQRIARV